MKIERKDGKKPDPIIYTGGLRIVTQALHYTPDGRYRLILPHEVDEFIEDLMKCKLIACDTETTGLSWQIEHVIGMSFAVDEGPLAGYKGYYVNDRDSFMKFKKFFTRTDCRFIFHNAKFDLHMLMTENILTEDEIVEMDVWDTMLMSYLADENTRHGLKELSTKIVAPDADRFEKLLKDFMKSNDCKTYDEVPLDLLTDYASADTHYTLVLYHHYMEILRKENMLDPIADLFDCEGSLMDIENRLMKELTFQERRGVPLDIPFIEEYIKEIEDKLPEIEQRILDTAGAINVRSTDELYTKLVQLGANPIQFPKTAKAGKPQVNVDTLEHLLVVYKDNQAICKFIDAVTDLKDAEKQLNTYLKAFIELADADDRLHTNFNQHIARTGRLSSSEPNIQNIPKVYKKLRACFSCKPGWNIAFYDYSQIEMRVFADYSNDPVMIKAINDGRDLHSETIRELKNIPIEKWDAMASAETQEYKDLRQMGKTTNFGVVYGMGKKKTSDKLGLTKYEPVYQKVKNPETGEWENRKIGEDADHSAGMRFLNAYYAKYTGVQTLMSQAKQVISVRGFIRNRFNRRRRLESRESYKAINALIQGFSADMIKVAMIKVTQYLRKNKLKSRLINNIHDELWLEIPDEELWIMPVVKRIMETWIKPTVKVPVLVDIEISNTNWREKHHLSNDSRPEVIAIGEQIARGEY